MLTISQYSRRVLVADDDPLIRKLVASAIQREGFVVVIANNGRDAYRILKSDGNFGAAIFDMTIPHFKGLDMIRYMRTEKRLMRVPIMMISAEHDIRLMASSFAAGLLLWRAFLFGIVLRAVSEWMNQQKSLSWPATAGHPVHTWKL